MWLVKVKDRGRDLAVHLVEHPDEARELARVYVLLGYTDEKVIIEQSEEARQAA